MDEISYSGPSSSAKRRISKRAAMFGIFGIVILLLLGAVVFFVTKGSPKKEETKAITLPSATQEEVSEAPSPTPEESQAPSKTPSKSPSPTSTSSTNAKSSISVSIQNGSGESGVAAKAADILKAAGYTIASTGNADNFDYTDVTIKVKSSEKEILAQLRKDLSTDYTIGDTSSDLSEGQSYDALVIIGK